MNKIQLKKHIEKINIKILIKSLLVVLSIGLGIPLLAFILSYIPQKSIFFLLGASGFFLLWYIFYDILSSSKNQK